MALVDQQPHQFGHGDRRMRVIEVNRHLVGQLFDPVVGLEVAPQQVLQRGADKKVFLLQAQLATVLGAVIRIQHTRHVFRGILGFDRRGVVALVEQGQVDHLGRGGRPQPEGIDRTGAVARHQGIVGHRQHIVGIDPMRLFVAQIDAAAKTYGVLDFGPGELPRIAGDQPVIRVFDLAAFDHALGEHAVFIADAVAEAGQCQGRH